MKYEPIPDKKYYYVYCYHDRMYHCFEVNNIDEAGERANAIGLLNRDSNPIGSGMKYHNKLDAAWLLSRNWLIGDKQSLLPLLMTLHLDDGRELYLEKF